MSYLTLPLAVAREIGDFRASIPKKLPKIV